MRREDVGERAQGPRGLDINVDPGVRELLENVGKARYAVPSRGTHPGEVGIRLISDPTATVGDPIEGVVVEGEHHPVAGRVDVCLEVAVAERDGCRERREGVFAPNVGAKEGSATVGEPDRAGVIEVGVVGGAHVSSAGSPRSRCRREPHPDR